jgi:hypothetical protein
VNAVLKVLLKRKLSGHIKDMEVLMGFLVSMKISKAKFRRKTKVSKAMIRRELIYSDMIYIDLHLLIGHLL